LLALCLFVDAETGLRQIKAFHKQVTPHEVRILISFCHYSSFLIGALFLNLQSFNQKWSRTSLQSHAGCVNRLAFNATGSWLASGSDDRRVVVWNYQTKKEMFDIPTGHGHNIFGICWFCCAYFT
jgi:WD40 repeat protein